MDVPHEVDAEDRYVSMLGDSWDVPPLKPGQMMLVKILATTYLLPAREPFSE